MGYSFCSDRFSFFLSASYFFQRMTKNKDEKTEQVAKEKENTLKWY